MNEEYICVALSHEIWGQLEGYWSARHNLDFFDKYILLLAKRSRATLWTILSINFLICWVETITALVL